MAQAQFGTMDFPALGSGQHLEVGDLTHWVVRKELRSHEQTIDSGL